MCVVQRVAVRAADRCWSRTADRARAPRRPPPRRTCDHRRGLATATTTCAVGRRVRLVGRQRRMLVAEPARDSARSPRRCPTGRPSTDTAESSSAMSRNCPLPGPRRCDVREQDALHGVERREAIGDRHADLGRSGLGKPGDVHQPRLALDHHVVAGHVAARAGRAVTRRSSSRSAARSAPARDRDRIRAARACPGGSSRPARRPSAISSSSSARPSADFRSTATLFLLRLTLR